jgi:hypothetical protein
MFTPKVRTLGTPFAGPRIDATRLKPTRNSFSMLAEPSQLSTFEPGKLFIFSERTPKVSTTF